MIEQKQIIYEGEVQDQWGGVCLGKDTISSIVKKLESFLDSGKTIRVEIEYTENEDAYQQKINRVLGHDKE